MFADANGFEQRVRDAARYRCTSHDSNVGRGHVPADREAADGRDEQICTDSVVPATARRVVAPYGEGAIDDS